jgi:hypothetical protein
MNNPKRPLRLILIAGDVVTYLLVTLIGFNSHDTLAMEALPRMLATFVPFTVSWFVVAPWIGLFDAAILRQRSHLARVLLATTLAAPLGAFLRGLWLGSPILPVFVLVMMGVSGLGMLIWRAVFQYSIQRSDSLI